MTGHGGFRPNAGRPALPAGAARKVKITLALTPDDVAGLQACLEPGEKRAGAAHRLLREAIHDRRRPEKT